MPTARHSQVTEQRERTGEEAEDNRKLKGTQSRENHKILISSNLGDL